VTWYDVGMNKLIFDALWSLLILSLIAIVMKYVKPSSQFWPVLRVAGIVTILLFVYRIVSVVAMIIFDQLGK
jgi:hypothetical protein